MKQTVNFFQFCDSFSDTYKNNFSYKGKRALFDHLEQYEEETGEEIELDPVALCCEYSEYESLKDFQEQHGDEYKSLEDIEEQTLVIPIDGSERFIIQDF